MVHIKPALKCSHFEEELNSKPYYGHAVVGGWALDKCRPRSIYGMRVDKGRDMKEMISTDAITHVCLISIKRHAT